jgi:hypothetical protein
MDNMHMKTVALAFFTLLCSLRVPPSRFGRAHKWLCALLVVGSLFTSCSAPKIIPDDELSEIFHDVYLSNAYAAEQRVELDSLSIYEPVFARYGYTSEDVQYTIGNFAKRKSARMSDVVEAAIKRLETESKFYKHRIFVQDTLRQIASREFSRVVLFDPLIRVRRTADTARMRRTIRDVKPGRYEITYHYLLDSVDTNNDIRATFYFIDSTGRKMYNTVRSFRQLYGDEKLKGEDITLGMTASERHRTLVVNMNGYSKKDFRRPSLTIDSLYVRYFLPDDIARDSLSHRLLTLPSMDSLGMGYRQPHVFELDSLMLR